MYVYIHMCINMYIFIMIGASAVDLGRLAVGWLFGKLVRNVDGCWLGSQSLIGSQISRDSNIYNAVSLTGCVPP